MITAMPRIAIAVRDYTAAVETFREAFGMPVADYSEHTVRALGAHVGMCAPEGGSNLELMSPADPAKPLSRSLAKFLDQRGEGFYALMLEAPDPDAEAAELAQRGLEVMPLMKGAAGRDLHPRSTHGVLIRVYPDDSVRHKGPRVSAAPNLSGIAKVLVAVRDLGHAAEVYGCGLGLALNPPTADEALGVTRVVCRPPKGGSIELVAPDGSDRPLAAALAEHAAQRGEGMFALVLQADDPEAAAGVLERRGVEVRRGPLGCEARAFGARLLLEARGPAGLGAG
ncbi:MAG: VOC family protein [Acidimicrobiales bacterium]